MTVDPSMTSSYPFSSAITTDTDNSVHYRMNNITHLSTAVQDIHPGEELTISYIDVQLSRKERQSRLDDWGFKCKCAHCTMSDAEVAASDARIERVATIQGHMEKMVAGQIPIDTALADELVRGYEDERFLTNIGHAYTRAALVHSLKGNEKEAREMAKKAAEAMELEYGMQNKDAQAMKLLSEDLTAHWSWNALKRSEKRPEEREGQQQDAA